MSAIYQSGTIDEATLAQLYECNVIASYGVRVGTVIDLVRRDGQVVGFEVSGRGMFGVGAGHIQLPVTAITRVDGLDVHVAIRSSDLI